MAGDRPVESRKKSVVISFVLGFLSCAVVVCILHVVSGRETKIRNDILNGRLKIRLASKLKEDKKAYEELVELLHECRQYTNAVKSMEEEARSSNSAIVAWQEMHKKAYIEAVENIARFAIDHREVKAALTAKLAYTFLEPFTSGYGPMTEQYEKMSANSTLFLQEIKSQHSKTWQASIAICYLATRTPGDEEEHHREKIRILKSYLKKELAEPPEDDPAMEILAEWCGPYEGPLKAGMLQAIANSQYNLGTLGDRRDLFWLNKAQKTYKELVKQYPEYSERNGWVRSHISHIDKMLVEAMDGLLEQILPQCVVDESNALEMWGDEMTEDNNTRELWLLAKTSLPEGSFFGVETAWLDKHHTTAVCILFKTSSGGVQPYEYTNAYAAVVGKTVEGFTCRQFIKLWDSEEDYNRKERLSLPMHHRSLSQKWRGRPKYSHANITALDMDSDWDKDLVVNLWYSGGSYSGAETFVLQNNSGIYTIILSKKGAESQRFGTEAKPITRITDLDSDGIAELMIWDELPGPEPHSNSRCWLDIYHWDGSKITQCNSLFPQAYEQPKRGFLEICKLYPDQTPEYYYYLGMISEYQARLDQAIEYYDKCLKCTKSPRKYIDAANERLRYIRKLRDWAAESRNWPGWNLLLYERQTGETGNPPGTVSRVSAIIRRLNYFYVRNRRYRKHSGNHDYAERQQIY